MTAAARGADSSPERLAGLDVLRGLALFGVVAIHICAALLLHPSRRSPSDLHSLVVLDLAARCSVPTFVILSGALLTAGWQRRPLPYLNFLRRRVWRIAPPYLLWSAVYTARGSDGLLALPRNLLFGQASYHTWYVPAIFYLYLLFPLLYRLLRWFLGTPRRRVALALAAGAAALWLRWPVGSSLAEPWGSWWRTGPRAALVWAPYLMLGMAAAPLRVPRSRRSWQAAAVIAGLVVLALTAAPRYQAVRAITDGSHAGQEATTGWARTDTPLATAAMLLILWPLVHRKTVLTAPLARLGRASYGAYLAHVLVMQVLLGVAPAYLRPAGPAEVLCWVLLIGGLSGLLVEVLARLPGLRPWSGVEHHRADGGAGQPKEAS